MLKKAMILGALVKPPKGVTDDSRDDGGGCVLGDKDF